MIRFIKRFERDTTFCTQSLWVQSLTQDLATRYNIPMPHRPLEIHFARESVQIWENEAGTEWLREALYEKTKTSSDFMHEIAQDHQAVLTKLAVLAPDETTPQRAGLREYFDTLRRGLLTITLVYYVSLDERTPPASLDVALTMREKDHLFAQSDQMIRNIYATLRGDDYAQYVLPHEYIEQLPSLETLEARSQNAVLIDGETIETTPLDMFAQSHPEFEFVDLLPAARLSSDSVVGQIASKGTARGIVRIVRTRSHCTAVEEGDIIVSPMTTPDFLPAMQRAAAYVTDEGGITCHAAIVSRELKKPCIIGTKYATQILKDGDLVEVDAERGVVTKLS